MSIEDVFYKHVGNKMECSIIVESGKTFIGRAEISTTFVDDTIAKKKAYARAFVLYEKLYVNKEYYAIG